jgi:hypothetical protein
MEEIKVERDLGKKCSILTSDSILPVSRRFLGLNS